jgi:fluoride exporter
MLRNHARMTAKNLILIACAGAVGTVGRVLLSGWLNRLSGEKFPWGTLLVNLLGCLLFGLIFALAEEKQLITPRLRLVLLSGFLGAFTTFSAFGFETLTLIRNDHWLLAIANVGVQNVLGVTAVFLGVYLARQMF